MIPMFVEEALRLEPPFRYHMRSVPNDTELGGVKIPTGATVLLLWGSANRDPAMFDHPETIDLTGKFHDDMSHSEGASTTALGHPSLGLKPGTCSVFCWPERVTSRSILSARRDGRTASWSVVMRDCLCAWLPPEGGALIVPSTDVSPMQWRDGSVCPSAGARGSLHGLDLVEGTFLPGRLPMAFRAERLSRLFPDRSPWPFSRIGGHELFQSGDCGSSDLASCATGPVSSVERPLCGGLLRSHLRIEMVSDSPRWTQAARQS